VGVTRLHHWWDATQAGTARHSDRPVDWHFWREIDRPFGYWGLGRDALFYPQHRFNVHRQQLLAQLKECFKKQTAKEKAGRQ
jgi:hypothetical protein